jgi:hypothetical protein
MVAVPDSRRHLGGTEDRQEGATSPGQGSQESILVGGSDHRRERVRPGQDQEQ